jgi:hypothetical protein
MGRRTFYVVSPVKVRLPKSKPKRVLKAIQYTTFEEAMVPLRQGRRIRRASWHPESFIFKTLDNMVFVSLPSSMFSARSSAGTRTRPISWPPTGTLPHEDPPTLPAATGRAP